MTESRPEEKFGEVEIVLPSPHPLDYDWRYDDKTASTLFALLRDLEPLVAIGAPTIARLMESRKLDVTLVDRQPFQNVKNQVAIEATEFVATRKFRAALVDPPWYPETLVSWAAIAGRAVGSGGIVFVSAWPEQTRPRAIEELNDSLQKISMWANITRRVSNLSYQTPPFEKIAAGVSSSTALSQSPRAGELIRLDVQRTPNHERAIARRPQWVRFVFNEYQIAVRIRERSDPTPSLSKLREAIGWQWPFVSARAPGFSDIDIWSSEGEVGTLSSTAPAIEAIRCALKAESHYDFAHALSNFPELLSWRIPRPPYRRKMEWLHP